MGLKPRREQHSQILEEGQRPYLLPSQAPPSLGQLKQVEGKKRKRGPKKTRMEQAGKTPQSSDPAGPSGLSGPLSLHCLVEEFLSAAGGQCGEIDRKLRDANVKGGYPSVIINPRGIDETHINLAELALLRLGELHVLHVRIGLVGTQVYLRGKDHKGLGPALCIFTQVMVSAKVIFLGRGGKWVSNAQTKHCGGK